MEIINKIKKKIISKKYNDERTDYMKKFICNIGKIIEEDDKITVYVDQKKMDNYLENYLENKQFYQLSLNGINQVTEGIKETIEKFGLNKPVYYIFDSINFNKNIQISSRWANVLFKNCSFGWTNFLFRDTSFVPFIEILCGDEITFENNKYTNYNSNYFRNNIFLTAEKVNKLTFINDNFLQNYDLKLGERLSFEMQIYAKLVEFINTKVDTEYSAPVKIKADKTKIENSSVKANEIFIDSDNIEFENSSLIAENGVIINNANCDFVGTVESPIIFYNGIDLADKNKKVHTVNEEAVTLKKARQKLIENLKNLSNHCQQINDNKVACIKDNLNNQNIVKTLNYRKR